MYTTVEKLVQLAFFFFSGKMSGLEKHPVMAGCQFFQKAATLWTSKHFTCSDTSGSLGPRSFPSSQFHYHLKALNVIYKNIL